MLEKWHVDRLGFASAIKFGWIGWFKSPSGGGRGGLLSQCFRDFIGPWKAFHRLTTFVSCKLAMIPTDQSVLCCDNKTDPRVRN